MFHSLLWKGALLCDVPKILYRTPPLFRVVLNYAMFARPGLKGGGPGSQKLKKVLETPEFFGCPALIPFKISLRNRPPNNFPRE